MRVLPFIGAFLASTVLSLSAFAAGTADEPLQNGLKALASADFTGAEKWFSLTRGDFPATGEGEQALLHETAIVVSRELAYLKLVSMFREGAALSRLESPAGTSYRSRAASYEDEARGAATRLAQLAPDLLAAKNLAQTLKFQIDTTGWDVDDLEGKIRKGEAIDEKEVEKLKRGELLKSYLGFWGTVFEMPEDRLFQSSYDAAVKPAVFFKAVGSRIYLSNRTKGIPERLSLAAKLLERVKDLTKDTPYDRNRQEALEFLEKVEKLRAASGSDKKQKTERHCPVDGALMQPEWKFCPVHGVKL